MNKVKALKILNPVLAVLFANQALSGIFHSAIQENLSYAAFKVWHGLVGYFFAALCVLHVILNWSWIRNTLFKRKVSS